MIKVFCDMCGKEIDYEKDGINLDFNHYGVVTFKHDLAKDHSIELCTDCANKVCDFITENGKPEVKATNCVDVEEAMHELTTKRAELTDKKHRIGFDAAVDVITNLPPVKPLVVTWEET